MSNTVVFILVVILTGVVSVAVPYSLQSQCDRLNPTPKKILPLEKIQGRWFSVRVRPPQNVPGLSPRQVPTAFTMDISSNGWVIINAKRASDKSCFYVPAVFRRLRTKPLTYEWFNTFFEENTRRNTRFLDTDYNNFLVAWTCIRFEADGRCKAWFVDLLSRQPKDFTGSVVDVARRSVNQAVCGLDYDKDFFVDPFEGGACKRIPFNKKFGRPRY